MTLYLNGHTFKYELEHLIKMFFPLIRLEIAYDGTEDDPNVVMTTRTERENKAALTVVVRYKGVAETRNATVDRGRPDYPAECERVFGVMIYEILASVTGIQPKWGVLTGIRPVKLVSARLEQGETDEEIINTFEQSYKVFPQKTKLLLETAKVEKKVLAGGAERDFSLYLSIPFCPSRCSYCSFVSHSVQQAKKLIPDYLETLRQEIRETGKIAQKLGLNLKSIYFGGGTPTVLTAEQLTALFNEVAGSFDLSALREYTVEAGRADTITKEKLQAIKQAGATRISINPQTFEDPVLEAVGRRHTAQQAIDCYRLAREVGFGCVNMDFIAGLPGDTFDGFCRTMETALKLAPENITVHTLSVKRAASLYRDEDSLELIQGNPTSAMAGYSQDVLGGAGYRPYYLYRQKNTLQNLENVGFCKPGFEGLYNIYIMEEVQTILALGAGAVTKLVNQRTGRIERIFNYKFPYEYIGQFNEMLRRKGQVNEFYEKYEYFTGKTV